MRYHCATSARRIEGEYKVTRHVGARSGSPSASGGRHLTEAFELAIANKPVTAELLRWQAPLSYPAPDELGIAPESSRCRGHCQQLH